MIKKTPDVDFKIFLAMIALLVIPAALTLRTVDVAREFVTVDNPTPLGYTWSLLTFILPVLALGWWFLRHEQYKIERKAFWFTIALFTGGGLILDIALGHTFFTFPNSGATLGIHFPGFDFKLGHFVWDVPIEEFGFYFFGCLFMLLFYIWADLFWFGAYNVDYETETKLVAKLVRPHPSSAIWGVVFVIAAILYKKFGPHPYHEGFPGYFTILVIAYVAPTFVFFCTVKPFVNWRAFSLTLYSMWLISLFWEVTLGLPYQWWGYHPEQMIGIFIGGWTHLPIEETLLWSVASWGTTMIYEVTRVYWYMGKPYREALFGAQVGAVREPPLRNPQK